VVLGCAFPEGEQGMNMAAWSRCVLACQTQSRRRRSTASAPPGCKSIAHVAYAIMAGQIQVAIAGGTESMSLVPMTGFKFAPMPYLAENMPMLSPIWA